jgi:hypothetical protein
MSQEYAEASELGEAEEVFDVVFPSCDEAAEVVHPGKEPFHFPASGVATQLSPVLRLSLSVAAVGRDHFDAVFFAHLLIQCGRVVGLVADQPLGQLVEEASGQNSFHKLALGMRSALDRYGERKTVASGDSDDLGALAAPRGTDREAPFLALAKVASTNASSRLSLPRSCRCLASSRSAWTNLPSRTHV